jgi:uncharacterized membrane protein YphA (DoxX/SURF4 family)
MAVLLARHIVAVLFLLSGLWKLRNRHLVKRTLRFSLSSRWFKRLKGLPIILPIVEAAIALALLGSEAMARSAAAAAALTVISFSAFLFRIPFEEVGCGCWNSAHLAETREPYLIRNAVILVLAAISTIEVDGTIEMRLTALIPGALLAATLLQLPDIYGILTYRDVREVARH